MLIDEFLCKRGVLGKRAPHSFTPPLSVVGVSNSLTSAIAAVKRIFHDRFLMMDMGPLHFFLGLEINQNASSIKLSQAKYA